MNLANMLTVIRLTTKQKDESLSGRASDLMESMKDKTEEADDNINRRIKRKHRRIRRRHSAGAGLKSKLDQQRTYTNREEQKRHVIRRRIVKFSIGRTFCLKNRSPLQTIAVICVKLDQGEPEEKIREYLAIEDELFAFCIEFAIENKLIIKQEDGRYEITNYGKEFASVF